MALVSSFAKIHSCQKYSDPLTVIVFPETPPVFILTKPLSIPPASIGLREDVWIIG